MSNWENALRDIDSWNKKAASLQGDVKQVLKNLGERRGVAKGIIESIGKQADLIIQRLAELNALMTVDGQQNEARHALRLEQARRVQNVQNLLQQDLEDWLAMTHQSIGTSLAYTTPARRSEKEVLDLIAKVRAEVQSKSTVNQQQVALANWLQAWAACIDEEEQRFGKQQGLVSESQEPEKETAAPQASTISGEPRQAGRSREEEGNLL